MIDYKDKIRKLLALAESPEENEAKAALLKARKLMAEHKLREEDCKEPEKLKVIKRHVGITCTKRLNSWIVQLSAVIAENYCCTAFRTRKRGMQTVEIGFIGFEDDFEVCERIFKYAVDCVLSKCKALKKEHSEVYTTKYVHKICDAYGYGFCEGVAEMFRRQNSANQEYGLVLVVPKEVREKTAEMGPPSALKQQERPVIMEEMRQAMAGREDGEKFDPGHRLAAESCGGGGKTEGGYCPP